jgi:hypothetical protein
VHRFDATSIDRLHSYHIVLPCIETSALPSTPLLFLVILYGIWLYAIGTKNIIRVECRALCGIAASRGVGKWDEMGMESAVNVEWEPMTKLVLRIEDGVHYDHDHSKSSQKQPIPVARGVFCGYRYTPEKYNRLTQVGSSK